MLHAHRFPSMLPADGEECIAYGVCECGLKKYFMDYYGELRKGVSIEGITKRVIQLNEEFLKEWEAMSKKPVEQSLPPVPEKPKTRNLFAIHKYYKDNAPRIIEECQKYGISVTRDNWGISLSAWNTFCRDHDLENMSWFQKLTLEVKTKESPKIVRKNQLENQRLDANLGQPTKESPKIEFKVLEFFPDYPKFNPNWPAELQIEWVRTYGVLVQAHDFVEKVRNG